MRPEVSIIMPSYNHSYFLCEAIDSVLIQNFENFELIIIDDASVDNSTKIIQNYLEKDKRIFSIFHSKNMGIAVTLNEGIKRSNGKYIAFISSDDCWENNKLKLQMDKFHEDRDIGVIWTEGQLIDHLGNSMEILFSDEKHSSNKLKNGNIFKELLKGNMIFISGVIVKKELLKEIRFLKCFKYLNDWIFYLDLARFNNFYFISKPVSKYRIHGRNTNKDIIGYHRDFIMALYYILTKYNKSIPIRIKISLLINYIKACFSYARQYRKSRFLYNLYIVNPFNFKSIFSLFFFLLNKLIPSPLLKLFR